MRGAVFVGTQVIAVFFCGSALAGAPVHPPIGEFGGFNRPCGAAVDSEGDVYVASAGDAAVKVFNPAHTLLATIANLNEPCGLAVDSRGRLYVSEKATGKVVRYAPDAYPLTATPSYGAPAVFDSSGNARGISIDPSTDRLYVAEGNRIASFQPDGTTGRDEVQEIIVPGTITGGEFTLSFEGKTSAELTVDHNNALPSNEEIETALEALETIGPGNVSVEEGVQGARSHFVTFTNALGGKDVPSLEADSSKLTGGSVFVNAGGDGKSKKGEGFAFNGIVGEGQLTDATAVAALGFAPNDESRHSLFVADSASDEVKVFSGTDLKAMQPTLSIDGRSVPDSSACPDCSEGFEFGPGGAALAVDRATGHLLVYDAGHEVLDEFEASGRYLDQISSPALKDAEPSGVATLPQRDELQELTMIASAGTFRLVYEGEETAPLPANASPEAIEAALQLVPAIGSGNVLVDSVGSASRIRFTEALGNRNIAKLGVNDLGLTGGGATAAIRTVQPGYGPGRVYVTSGAGPGGKLLAFGPLAAPSRQFLPQLTRELEKASSVAVDSHGDVYVGAGPLIHIFDPSGSEISVTTIGKLGAGIADEVQDLDIDSTGKVYVLDEAGGKKTVTYYTPSAYPPQNGTTYQRHVPPVETVSDLPVGNTITSIAVDRTNDHLFVSGTITRKFGSAEEGSTLLDPCFACSIAINVDSLVVDGAGKVYVDRAEGLGSRVLVTDAATPGGILAEINGAGGPWGPLPGGEQRIAVDQASGHVLVFKSSVGSGFEFDGAGGFVAEFGEFESVLGTGAIAVDNACAEHEPPLTGSACEAFDPADGNVYIAYDDPSSKDLSAFGPLGYGEVPAVVTGPANGLGGGEATLNGTVDPHGFQLEECHFEYLLDSAYLENEAHSKPLFEGASSSSCAESPAEIGHGNGPVAVHLDLGLLSDPQGRYRFRLIGANEFGKSTGVTRLFGPPLPEARKAQPVLYDEATLRAHLDPTGLAATYRFQYGTVEGQLDKSTPDALLPADSGPQDVSAALAGLGEGTTYYFRLVAENEDVATPVASAEGHFTTLERASAETCPNGSYRSGLAAHLPDCRAYELTTPAETNGLGLAAAGPAVTSGSIFNNWLVVPRGESAGVRLSYFTEGTLPGFDGNGRRDGYTAVRGPGDHPSSGWQNDLFGPTFRQAAPGTFNTVSQQGVAAGQSYSFWNINPEEILEGTLAKGLYLRGPAGFEVLGRGSLGEDLGTESHYLDADGSHVIFSSKAHLEPDAAPPGTEAIYDRAAGQSNATVVSVKAGGEAFGAGEAASYIAASEDGSAIVFKVGSALFLNRGGQVTQVSSSYESFDGLSRDGSRLFYTKESGKGYVFDAAGATSTLIAEAVTFANVSADGRQAFFSSTEELTGTEENENGEAAESGANNLYAYDAETGETKFIARLVAADFSEFGGDKEMSMGRWSTAISAGLKIGRGEAPTRSTPNGSAFVFQSHARLTDYENGGAGEIYRYDPTAEAGQQLLCVSCDPSETSPTADAMLEIIEPPKSPLQPSTVVENLTEDGSQVFFQSPDRLLPEDANAVSDVYEWRAEGTAGCGRASGCLGLISSGQGEGASYLYSASGDGRDVFFRTNERLVGSDIAGSLSIYDARAGGGIPEPVAAAPCQGDACQGVGSEPPVLATPTTTGSSDDQAETPKTRCPRGRHLAKGHCVKRKRHKQGRHKNHHRASHAGRTK